MKKIISILFIICSLFSSMAYAQGGLTYSGTVIGEDGFELIGVSVAVKGTSIGVITDLDGKFRLNNIPPKSTIVFSYVGFENKEVKITESKERETIVLKQSISSLDEVVVVGRGSQRKVSVVGAITSVDQLLVKSQLLARKIIKDFKPHAAVGVGGYASGPTLKMAGMMGIPTLIQEQNSYAGVTNKLLAKKACKICVAYDGMERFFEKDKIILTGNPVRQGLRNHHISREEAIRSFGLDPSKKTILIVGGSLGARTINNCVMEGLDKIKASGAQFIWQTGKIYIGEARAAVAQAGELPMLHVTDFISDMAAAYSAADLIISRAGAGSISEFCLLQKPVILVPSPNVAEDHQTKNALALVNKNAALYIKDAAAKEALLDKAVETVKQPETLKSLSTNIAKLAFTDSANVIAREVFKLADKYRKENGR